MGAEKKLTRHRIEKAIRQLGKLKLILQLAFKTKRLRLKITINANEIIFKVFEQKHIQKKRIKKRR